MALQTVGNVKVHLKVLLLALLGDAANQPHIIVSVSTQTDIVP